MMASSFASSFGGTDALAAAFPTLDLDGFGLSAPAPALGAGGAEATAANFDDHLGADAFEPEADAMPVAAEDDGPRRGADLDGTAPFDGSADASQMPLGASGAPGAQITYLGAEDVAAPGAQGEQDAAGAAVLSSISIEPERTPEISVPELPADGACLRATHLRSMMPSDAGLEAVHSACRGLGHVVSDVTASATVLCTAVDSDSGAPVDYTVQAFRQSGCDDLVLEVQHAGRGDRLAFIGVYASVAEQLRAEAGCGAAVAAAELEAAPRTPLAAGEPLGPPPPLSARAATVGTASAAPARPAPDAPRAASADDAVPGCAGLALVASRLRAAALDAAQADASDSAEAAAAVASRIAAMTDEARLATIAALDEAALPAALLDVLHAAAAAAEAEAPSAALAAEDSTVVPALVAVSRLLACPGDGCRDLTATGAGALTAVRAVAQAAKAAALQHRDAAREMGAAPPALPGPQPCRDGPQASSASWLASSGAVLRLRAAAAALGAAAARPGQAPEGASPSGGASASWADVVAEAAADGIAALVGAAASLGDAELSAAVDALKAAGRR